LLAAALFGCASTAPEVDVETKIAEAIPSGAAIVFRAEAAALDEVRPDPLVLTRAEAVRLALETDPRLQQSLARVVVARTDAESAGLLPNPVLDVVLRFAEGGELQPEIGLSADLIGILQRPARTRAAEHRLQAEAASALATALDVLHEVQERYSAAQALEARGTVLAERLSTVQRMRAVAQARFEAGEGRRADLEAFEIEAKSIEIDAAGTRTSLQRERLALARLIGTPSRAADWQLDLGRASPAQLPDEAAWVRSALAYEPEAQRARWEVAAREEELGLASTAPLEGTAVGVAAQHEGEWSVGPSLSGPIPLPGRFRLAEERARASLAESRHRLSAAERAAVSDVRVAHATVRATLENLNRFRVELVPLLERRRADVERAYQARELDVTFLLLADQALLEARERMVELDLEATTAWHRLERAAGGPAAFERVIDPNSQSPHSKEE
jgi:outer membrane protein TolC